MDIMNDISELIASNKITVEHVRGATLYDFTDRDGVSKLKEIQVIGAGTTITEIHGFLLRHVGPRDNDTLKQIQSRLQDSKMLGVQETSFDLVKTIRTNPNELFAQNYQDLVRHNKLLEESRNIISEMEIIRLKHLGQTSKYIQYSPMTPPESWYHHVYQHTLRVYFSPNAKGVELFKALCK